MTDIYMKCHLLKKSLMENFIFCAVGWKEFELVNPWSVSVALI